VDLTTGLETTWREVSSNRKSNSDLTTDLNYIYNSYNAYNTKTCRINKVSGIRNIYIHCCERRIVVLIHCYLLRTKDCCTYSLLPTQQDTFTHNKDN
jgi:hypothetical protein